MAHKANETEKLLRILAMLSHQREIAKRRRALWGNASRYDSGLIFGLTLAIGELTAICKQRLPRGSAANSKRRGSATTSRAGQRKDAAE